MNIIGKHVSRQRRVHKLMQKDVGEQMSVDKCSIHNWEANTSIPAIQYMPAIIAFLGYNPLPEANTLGEKLVRHRTTPGITQKQANASRR